MNAALRDGGRIPWWGRWREGEDTEGRVGPRKAAGVLFGLSELLEQRIECRSNVLLPPHDSFSNSVGLLAQKKILSIKIQKAMARRKMTKVALAKAMETSRTVVQRLLDPTDTGVTLATLWRASRALGVKLVEEVEEERCHPFHEGAPFVGRIVLSCTHAAGHSLSGRYRILGIAARTRGSGTRRLASWT